VCCCYVQGPAGLCGAFVRTQFDTHVIHTASSHNQTQIWLMKAVLKGCSLQSAVPFDSLTLQLVYCEVAGSYKQRAAPACQR
jgi:hypothetical protein